MAAAMIIVGITTWIETVIETAAEAIMIEDVMMTKSGGTKGCFKTRNQ